LAQEELTVATLQHTFTRSVLVQEELAKQQVTVLSHPLYSPDFFFFFFSRLKEKLRGRRFQSAKEIVTSTRKQHGTFLQISFSNVYSHNTNVGRLAYRPTATVIRKDVDICKCM
jgi:hypothetical protein